MAITAEKIQSLLADLENDCVERTISTTDTDKFAKAIQINLRRRYALLQMTFLITTVQVI